MRAIVPYSSSSLPPARIARREVAPAVGPVAVASGWPHGPAQTVVFIDARGLPYHPPPAYDPAGVAPRLAPAIDIEGLRPTRPPDHGWVHQALTPLPTEGYLALRAATATYRKTA